MNDKFSLYNIAELLAERTGANPEKSERFITELIELINETIRKEGGIKVKGLGTFKIVFSEERKEIKNEEGEYTVIPARHELSFQADKTLEDIINRPFSFFETTEVGEDELKKMTTSGTDEPAKNTTGGNITYPTPLSSHTGSDAPTANGNKDTAEKIKNPETVNTPSPKPQTSARKAVSKSDSKKEKKSKRRLVYPVLILFICILFGCIWYFAFRQSSSSGNFREKKILRSEAVSGSEFIERASRNESVKTGEEPKTAPERVSQNMPSPTVKRQKPKQSPSPSVETEIIADIKIKEGDRLTLLARKYYGHKIFWVYIYDYNKDKIGPDPDKIQIGIKLSIPAKKRYGIDAGSPDSREKARKIQTQLMSGKK